MTSRPLQGCSIVVTRPTGQAEELLAMLEAAGAQAVHFPVIEIRAVEDQQGLIDTARSLESYDLAIFVSRNAVNYGIEIIRQARRDNGWPSGTRIAAIGSGTAHELEKAGLNVDISPSSIASSENLLNEPGMKDVAGKRILIFRGNGGREKLAEVLRQRNATVNYFECYRRKLPEQDAQTLSTLWHRNAIQGIIVTSSEGLKNLYQMVKPEDIPRLNETPLYVITSTMVELSRKLGYKQMPVLMPSASNADILASLIEHCTNASGE